MTTLVDSTIGTSSGTGPHTITLPTHASGDWIYLIVEGYTSLTDPISGWTTVLSNDFTHAFGSDGIVKVYKKQAASSSETNPQVTNGQADQCDRVVFTMRGIDDTATLTATAESAGGSGTINAPSIDITGHDFLISFAGVYPSSGGGSFTSATGMTIQESGGGWNFCAMASLAAPADPTGTHEFIDSLGGVQYWHSLSLAFKSAGAAATSSPPTPAIRRHVPLLVR